MSRNSRQQKLDKKTSFDEVPQVQLLHIQGRRNPCGQGNDQPHPIFWQRRQPYSNQERADYAHHITFTKYSPPTPEFSDLPTALLHILCVVAVVWRQTTLCLTFISLI